VRIGSRLALAVGCSVALVAMLWAQAALWSHVAVLSVFGFAVGLVDGMSLALALVVAWGAWERFAAGLRWLEHNRRYDADTAAVDQEMRRRVAEDPALRAKFLAALETAHSAGRPSAPTPQSATFQWERRMPAAALLRLSSVDEHWSWPSGRNQLLQRPAPLRLSRTAEAGTQHWLTTALCSASEG
jgi:hypothetical protein